MVFWVLLFCTCTRQGILILMDDTLRWRPWPLAIGSFDGHGFVSWPTKFSSSRRWHLASPWGWSPHQLVFGQLEWWLSWQARSEHYIYPLGFAIIHYSLRFSSLQAVAITIFTPLQSCQETLTLSTTRVTEHPAPLRQDLWVVNLTWRHCD